MINSKQALLNWNEAVKLWNEFNSTEEEKSYGSKQRKYTRQLQLCNCYGLETPVAVAMGY